jgi:hypothetical protein
MRALLGSLALSCFGVALSSAAHADPDVKQLAADARQLAQDGLASGDTSKLRAAIELYRQAYEVDANPLFLCNIAYTYDVLGDLPRADALLLECIPRLSATMPEAVGNFRQALDAVEAKLPEHHVAVDFVTVPAGASLDIDVLHGDITPTAPAVVWLPEGDHTITATLPGRLPETRTVTITAEDVAGHPRKSVTLTLDAEPPPVKVEPPPPEPVPVPPASNRRRNGWLAVGVGGAMLAAGGVMHAITYQDRTELAALSGDAYDDKYPTFRNERAVTYSLYGIGGAAAIAGAIMILTAPSTAERIAISPAPSGTGAMVWLDLSP